MLDTMGLIFTYKYEEDLKTLTQVRSISSIPFGGRYRIIDFLLSSMVNSGMTKVGMSTKNNYQSLMDHVGYGKESVSYTHLKSKTLWTQNETGEKITLYQADTEGEEAGYIAGQMQKLHEEGRAYKDMAILFRTNAQSRALEEHLLRDNIPYRLFAGIPFYLTLQTH